MGHMSGLSKLLRGQDLLLMGSVVALILTRTVDQTLYYRFNYEFGFFVWYFSALILPIGYLVMTWPVVWYLMRYTDTITPQMSRFPKWKLAVMGALDCAYNLASTFPVQHIGGNLANVLSQTVLPMNMVFGYIFLKMRFRWNHYLSALLVIGGVIIKMSPDLANSDAPAGWIMLFIGSQLFNAGSNIYKEIGLKDANLNEFYANAWIGLFQLMWGILTCWTLFIGAFVDPHPPINSAAAMGEFLGQSNDCFLGKDVVIRENWESMDCSGGIQYPVALADGCQVSCSKDGAPIYLFMVYILFNVAFNQLMLVVLKRGSSVLFVVSNAVRLPLVAALNAWSLIAGPAQEPFVWQDGVALVVLVAALASYYYKPEIKPPVEALPKENTPLLVSTTTEAND